MQATPGTMLHCTAVHGTYTHTHTLPACMHDGVIHVTHSGVGMSAGYSLAQPAHARMLPLMPLLDFLGFYTTIVWQKFGTQPVSSGGCRDVSPQLYSPVALCCTLFTRAVYTPTPLPVRCYPTDTDLAKGSACALGRTSLPCSVMDL